MAELWADPVPRNALLELRHDESRRALLSAVLRVLAQLRADPADASVRLIRFHTPPLWCVPIRSSEDEWVLLWEPHPERTGAVAIRYLGPASFA